MTSFRCWLLAACASGVFAGCGCPAEGPRAGSDGPAAAAAPSGRIQAASERRRGRDLGRQGKAQEAVLAFEAALALYARDGASNEQAATLNELGEVLFQLGDFARLEAAEWRALELADASGDSREAATAWNNLGVSFAARGAPSAALAAYGHSVALRRGLDDRSGEASALHNLGVQLSELGRVDEGIAELERAVELHRGASSPVALGQSLAALAWGLASNGRTDAALAVYDEAVALLGGAGANYDLAIACEQRAQLHRRQGHFAAARADLDRSRTLAASHGGPSEVHAAYLELGAGAILREEGRAAEALDPLRHALARFETLGAGGGRALARLELARALRAAGERGEAIARLEEAMDLVEATREGLSLPAFRSGFFGQWQEVYQELVDLLAQTASAETGEQRRQVWAERALAVAERARARSLLDLLATPDPATDEPSASEPPELLALRRELETLEAEALARDRDQGPGRPSRRLTELRRARVELERAEELAWRSAGRRPSSAPPSAVATIRQQLDAETVLLVYQLGPERSWLWRLDAQGSDLWPLPPGPELDAAARNVHQLLPLAERSGYAKAGRAALAHLGALLLAPVAGSLAAPRRIVVVPDGALHLVPFAALPLPQAGDGPPKTLAAHHEVLHLPSASALVELRRRRASRQRAPHLLALVTDPVFAADDPRLGSTGAATEPRPAPALERTRRAFGRALARLPAAADEASRIAAVASQAGDSPAPPIFAAFDATRELVAGGRLAGFRLLHFATHGLVDAEDPALAGLVLSLYGEDGRRRDGLLRARDLQDLELGAELVVLSACRTALGQEVRGEGVQGLASAFFAAGASQLIVSLWDVDDQATAELMARFYTHLLLAGERPAEALRQAQRELREETGWSSPASWAAFVAIGDWQADVGE